MTRRVATLVVCGVVASVVGCNYSRPVNGETVVPRQIIDLSPTITEDLPVRIWGHRALKELGFSDSTEFRVISGNDPVYYQNSYYTLFNHGGPHVDAPNHLERGDTRGIDSYNLESLVGPIRLVDVRGSSADQRVNMSELKAAGVVRGDIVIMLTGYIAPVKRDELPSIRALSKEAAEYLASIPVRAFGTDSLSVDVWGLGGLPYEQSVHHVFLAHGIPIVEQLTNLEALIATHGSVFVGLPLKVKGGDGSPIRAAAFLYY